MNESRAELDQPKYEKYFAESEQLKGNFDLGQGSVEVCPSTLGFDEGSERKCLPVKIAGNWRLFYKSGSTKEWRQLIALQSTTDKDKITETWLFKDNDCNGRVPWPLHKYLVEAENRKLISFAEDPQTIPEDVFETLERTDLQKAAVKFEKHKMSFQQASFLDQVGKPKELPDFSQSPVDVVYNDGTVDWIYETPNFRFRINFDPNPTDRKRFIASGVRNLSMPVNCVFGVEAIDPHQLVTNVPTYEPRGKADPQFLEIVEKIKQSEIYQKIENQTERLTPEIFKALIS